MHISPTCKALPVRHSAPRCSPFLFVCRWIQRSASTDSRLFVLFSRGFIFFLFPLLLLLLLLNLLTGSVFFFLFLPPCSLSSLAQPANGGPHARVAVVSQRDRERDRESKGTRPEKLQLDSMASLFVSFSLYFRKTGFIRLLLGERSVRAASPRFSFLFGFVFPGDATAAAFDGCRHIVCLRLEVDDVERSPTKDAASATTSRKKRWGAMKYKPESSAMSSQLKNGDEQVPHSCKVDCCRGY